MLFYAYYQKTVEKDTITVTISKQLTDLCAKFAKQDTEYKRLFQNLRTDKENLVKQLMATSDQKKRENPADLN